MLCGFSVEHIVMIKQHALKNRQNIYKYNKNQVYHTTIITVIYKKVLFRAVIVLTLCNRLTNTVYTEYHVHREPRRYAHRGTAAPCAPSTVCTEHRGVVGTEHCAHRAPRRCEHRAHCVHRAQCAPKHQGLSSMHQGRHTGRSRGGRELS